MTVLENIKSHFKELEPVAIDVKEWKTTFYAFPPTLSQRSQILKRTKDSDDIHRCVETVLALACDEQGEPVFTRKDKPELMRIANPTVLIALASDLMTAFAVDEDEIEKN